MIYTDQFPWGKRIIDVENLWWNMETWALGPWSKKKCRALLIVDVYVTPKKWWHYDVEWDVEWDKMWFYSGFKWDNPLEN